MPNFSGVPAVFVLFDDRRERDRRNGWGGWALSATDRLLHLFPDVFGDVMPLPFRSMLNARDEVCLRAEADGRGDRLARQHVRAVEFAADDAVEKDFPVRLRLERDEKTFVLEVASSPWR